MTNFRNLADDKRIRHSQITDLLESEAFPVEEPESMMFLLNEEEETVYGDNLGVLLPEEAILLNSRPSADDQPKQFLLENDGDDFIPAQLFEESEQPEQLEPVELTEPAEVRESAEPVDEEIEEILEEHVVEKPAEEDNGTAAPQQPESVVKAQPVEPEKKKKKSLWWILLVLLLLLLLVGGYFLLDYLKQRQQWTDWSQTIPEKIAADPQNYEIETRQLYSYRKKNIAEYDQPERNGWTLYGVLNEGDWGLWSEWSDKEVTASEEMNVEEADWYRSRSKQFYQGSESYKPGWTQYDSETVYTDEYGEWSDWSTEYVADSDTVDGEAKIQYRYKLTTTSPQPTMVGWMQEGEPDRILKIDGDFGDWGFTVLTASDTQEVETRNVYRYFTLLTETSDTPRDPSTGWTETGREPLYSDWADQGWTYEKPVEGATVSIIEEQSESYYLHHFFRYVYLNSEGTTCYTSLEATASGNSSDGNYNKEDKYFDSTTAEPSYATHGGTDGEGISFWQLSGDGNPWYFDQNSVNTQQTRIRYHYQTREISGYIYTYQKSELYRDWDPERLQTSETMSEETAIQYRSRPIHYDLIYHYYQITDWLENAPQSENCVMYDTRMVYRYRTKLTKTTYFYWKWGEFSEFSDRLIKADDNTEVETKKYYRFQNLIKETTYLHYCWSDWSEFSETPVEASEDVEVKVITEYRYRHR